MESGLNQKRIILGEADVCDGNQSQQQKMRNSQKNVMKINSEAQIDRESSIYCKDHNKESEQAYEKKQPFPQQHLRLFYDEDSSAFSISSSSCSSQQELAPTRSSKPKNPSKQKHPSPIGTYRKYSRITPEIKQRLVDLIARQNMSIKEASLKLKINYSSAKFIFSQYRDKKLQIIDREMDVNERVKQEVVLEKISEDNQMREQWVDCLGKERSEGNGIVIRCSSGGRFEAQSDKVFGLKQILQLYSISKGQKLNVECLGHSPFTNPIQFGFY